MREPVRVRLLAAGALAGLACAAFGLLDFRSGGELPEFAAARVNDTVISKQSLGEALSRLQHDSRELLSADDEEWVLNRLVEEELLVQHGLALGLAHSEHNVRATIVQSLITAATAEASASNPDDATLEAFYEANRALFSAPPAVALRVWTTPDEALASAMVAGEADIQSGDAERIRALPESLMPISKIRDYLGPTLTTRISQRRVTGIFSETVSEKHFIIQILALENSETPPFASIRSEVLARYRQTSADQALRDYIDLLRRRATVIVSD